MIEVEGLGRRYRLGALRGQRTLREALASPLSAFRRAHARECDELWALRDVTFRVAEGEAVGLIGSNGAGKSTLLKILSRVTPPTTGTARLHGRTAALLGVGTGFHPELSGRENIFLSGAVLGMSRQQVRRKFDEIVAFAEVERFLDTPIKHYSSGMHVRLGFAVAAHLEPDILLIDEVLAVGDAAFRTKCLGKMDETLQRGRTILFVSHDLSAVQALCQRALLFTQGRLAADGPATEVCATYIEGVFGAGQVKTGGRSWFNREALQRDQAQGFRFTSVVLENASRPGEPLRTGDGLKLSLGYEADRQYPSAAFRVSLRNCRGTEVLRLSTMPISGVEIESLHPEGRAELVIEALPLVADRYRLDVALMREQIAPILVLENIAGFEMLAHDAYGSGFGLDDTRGMIVVPHRWSHHERRSPQ